jgi:hypothetical protein
MGPKAPTTCWLSSPKWAAVPQNCAPWSLCRKSGPGMTAACRLCSQPAAAAVASGSPHPRASTASWAPDDLSSPDLLPYRYPQLTTQCQGPATTHPRESQALGLAILLVPGGFPPHRAQRPSTPHCYCKRAPALPSKSRNSSPPQWGEKRGNQLAPQQEPCKG